MNKPRRRLQEMQEATKNRRVTAEVPRSGSRFKTTMDGYTQALDEPKRLAQERLANLIMRTGKVGHA